jgi:hypothetical protein
MISRALVDILPLRTVWLQVRTAGHLRYYLFDDNPIAVPPHRKPRVVRQ